MKIKSFIKHIFVSILIISTVFMCTSCSKNDRAYPETYEELDGLRAGVMTGSIQEDAVLNNFPNSPIQYFNNMSDVAEALFANKIDYFVNSFVASRSMLKELPQIHMIETSVFENEYAFIFKKNDDKSAALRAQFDEFVLKHREDGVLDELEKIWVDDENVTEHPPTFEIPNEGENGTLVLATSSTMTPFCFIYQEELTGFDVQLACMFCKEYGYGIRFADSDFAGIIPAVSSGKADFGAACITITEERAKSVDYSKPYSTNQNYPMVLKKEDSQGGLEELKENFYKTFIAENRWKLILNGLLVTFAISFLATIFGTLFGFILFIISRKAGKIFNNIIEKFSWVFSGLPMIVVLMILYYIVFAKLSISGIFVAAIAFSISIMLSVNSKLQTAVKSIDNGQIEGALSLGFNDSQTLFFFVLPQAMEQFMPNYLTLIIELIKGTSIVGYIAVQDLTKASDIIRSRTYEAFFPIIATALIYLVIIVVITVLFEKLAAKIEPKNRCSEDVLRRYKK